MEKILFGDNQFFGINHMSEDKARSQSIKFQDPDAIIQVLDYAYDCGIRAFMCTTHDKIALICDHVKANPSRYDGLVFYPCMPYAHKYANAVTEHGMLGALRLFLPQEGAFSGLLKGSFSLASKDVAPIAKMLIDAEMKMFDGLPTPVIFVQNVLTDLLLGMGFDEGFRIFHDHITQHYKAEPAFITMNLPRLLDVLERLGIVNPIVCSNINKIGFRMSGGLEAYESAIANRQFRPVAMSILASGAVSPKAAGEYLAKLKKVEAVVFGASSRGNIQSTVNSLRDVGY